MEYKKNFLICGKGGANKHGNGTYFPSLVLSPLLLQLGYRGYNNIRKTLLRPFFYDISILALKR